MTGGGTLDFITVALALAISALCVGCDTSSLPGTSSLGCEDGALTRGDHHVELEHDGALRTYEVHIPPGYDGVNPLPVVLNFHGFTNTPAIQAENSLMNQAGDEHDMIVVYPAGLDNSWNGGTCCGASRRDDVDDVGFAREVVADLGRQACINPRRVYATGASNGGFLAHRLACEAADLIAAAAPVIGSLGLPEGECAPSRGVSVLHFHGTEDAIIPYEGGGVFQSRSVVSSHAEMVTAMRCRGSSRVTFAEGAVTCETVDQCRDGATVTLCTVEGGEHCWFGHRCGGVSGEFPVTPPILEFFEGRWPPAP